jgi:phage tail-like protein
MAGNGVTLEESTYLRYLPAIYRQDMFVGRFLRIFEDVLTPVQGLVNTLTFQFDPTVASPAMMALLASWVGADPPEGLDEISARRFVKQSMTIHRSRGTKEALRAALDLVTGRRAYITEYSPGLVLGEDASLGLNTALEDGAPLRFHVAFDCAEDEVDPRMVHAIIQRLKPAHVGYTISFRPAA